MDPALAVSCAAPAPVTEHTASERDVIYTALVRVTEYVDHAVAVSEHVALAFGTRCTAPVPVTEYVGLATGAKLEATETAFAHGLDAFSWENIAGQRVSYRTAANWGFFAVTSRECHPASSVLSRQVNDDWLKLLGIGQCLPLRHHVDGSPLFRRCRPQDDSSIFSIARTYSVNAFRAH